MRFFCFVFTLLFALLVVTCDEPVSSVPTDIIEKEDPPTIGFDSSKTTIFMNDTIHFDSGMVTLVGNSDKSKFQIKLDEKTWSSWVSPNTHKLSSLADGKHVLHMRTCYNDGIDTVEDSISFFVLVAGYKPAFIYSNDTSVTVVAGTNVLFSDSANGARTLNFFWYKDSSSLKYESKKLSIQSVAGRDAGRYRCVVSNTYGIDTGRVFTLKIKLIKGSITGKVLDHDHHLAQKGVDVTLLPDSTETITDNNGNFTFTNLTEGTYKLMLSLTDFIDTTVSDIVVSDTGVTAKGTIYMKKKPAGKMPRNLTYKGNGHTSGAAPVDTNKYYDGDSLIVAGNKDTLVKEFYNFNGWNTKLDGSGTSYDGGDTLVFDTTDIILYAKWTTIPVYKVTYFASGITSGTVPKDPKTYVSGSTITVRSNSGDMVKSGYTFAGWDTVENSGVATLMPGDTLVVKNDSLKLYAQWSIKKFEISYDGNGNDSGSVPPDSLYRYGDTVTTRSIGNLVKKGYTFIAWCTSANGEGTMYLEGKQIVMGGSDITLYAIWKVNSYEVSYNGNGNTGGSAPVKTTAIYNTSVTIAKVGNLVREGYTFEGWNTAVNGSGVSYRVDTTINMGLENITLYAQWKVIKFKVHFSTRGGSSIPDTTVNYNSVITVPKDPVRTGYVLAGWYKEASYVNQWVFATDKITKADTLYARWYSPRGMVWVAANDSTFQMGSSLVDNEKPVHPVKLTKDFWMDSTEVTQKQYVATMRAVYGSSFNTPDWINAIGAGDNYPVYFVNWYDAALYCNARTKETGSNDTFYLYAARSGSIGDSSILINVTFNWDAKGFRLPTEAQWEYARRGKEGKDYFWGKDLDPYPTNVADSNEIDYYAVWKRNSLDKGEGKAGYGVHEVARTIKNGFNLFDMCGNVEEWVNDWYADSYGSNTQKTDPTGPQTGESKVYRGGSWKVDARHLRKSERSFVQPNVKNDNIGFRTCLPPE